MASTYNGVPKRDNKPVKHLPATSTTDNSPRRTAKNWDDVWIKHQKQKNVVPKLSKKKKLEFSKIVKKFFSNNNIIEL